MITSKTISYICHRIQRDMPDLYARIPATDKNHADVRADWRGAILLDAVRNITQQNAQVLIKFIEAKDEKSVEQFVFGINGLNN